MQQKEIIHLYPSIGLDAQHRELLRIFVLRHPRFEETGSPYAADIIAAHPLELLKIGVQGWPTKHLLILDFGDLYMRKLGVRDQDKEYRQEVTKAGKTFIYLQAEPNPSMPVAKYGDPPAFREIYSERDPSFIQLSVPLGYCSGAKMNLSYPDYDESAYFVNNFEKNPKTYYFDFCWIGAESSPDRRGVLQRLFREYSHNGLWTNIANEDLITDDVPEEPDGANKILIKSGMPTSNTFQARLKELNADNKTIPYAKYLDFHRKSKVNISCNGFSMWNYMDGEYFSRNCFNLRQHHPGLICNPYSPKDGVHWVVFTNDELLDKLTYYIQHDEERERINDAGFAYFKESICGGWAKIYGDMLVEYLNTGNDAVFDKVRL